MSTKKNIKIIDRLSKSSSFHNSLNILSRTLVKNKKYQLVGWGVKETILGDIHNNNLFNIKKGNKLNKIVKKARLSDFKSKKTGISKLTISNAFNHVNYSLNKIKTDRLGKHELYLLNTNKQVIRNHNGKKVDILTALSESGYGFFIASYSQYMKYNFNIYLWDSPETLCRTVNEYYSAPGFYKDQCPRTDGKIGTHCTGDEYITSINDVTTVRDTIKCYTNNFCGRDYWEAKKNAGSCRGASNGTGEVDASGCEKRKITCPTGNNRECLSGNKCYFVPVRER